MAHRALAPAVLLVLAPLLAGRFRVRALVTVAILAASTAGCASEPTTPQASDATASATPTPSATPAALKPEPRFDLSCDDIATTATLAAFISAPIEKQDMIANYSAQSPEIPRLTYIEAMGGLVCDWSNDGAPSNFSEQREPGIYHGASVLILPEADAQYAFGENFYSADLRCEPGTSWCGVDILVNGYWVAIAIHGVIVDDATLPLVSDFTDSVESLVAVLGAPEPRWAPPADTIPLPSDCASFAPATEVRAALQAPGELEISGGPHGGWSIWAGAQVEAGGGICGVWTTDSDESVGVFRWLHAGEWAATELLPETTYPSPATSVTVSNLAAGDSAFVRCTDDGLSCIVDLIIGGNWIQATTYEALRSPLGVQGSAIALAGAIAAHVYG